MSCMTAVHHKNNQVKFAHFVLLAASEEAKTVVISRVIKDSVRVVSLSR